MAKRHNTASFVELAIKKHGKKFDYTKTSYVMSKTKVVITCNNCSMDFTQTPNDHLSGCGCPNCCAPNKKLSTRDFIERSRAAHGSEYDYSKSVYKGAANKVKIICDEHGEFWQKAQYHMEGRKCLECSRKSNSWSRSDYIKACKKYKGISELYIIKCTTESEQFYKIGITAQGISTRHNRGAQTPYDYEVVASLKGESGFIWDMEKRLQRMNSRNKYKPKLSFVGSTECFSEIPAGITRLIKKIGSSQQLQLIA